MWWRECLLSQGEKRECIGGDEDGKGGVCLGKDPQSL
jgi:hypothetical protein